MEPPVFGVLLPPSALFADETRERSSDRDPFGDVTVSNAVFERTRELGMLRAIIVSGMLGAILPARRASRPNVLEALQYE
jgi:hypothetical protein